MPPRVVRRAGGGRKAALSAEDEVQRQLKARLMAQLQRPENEVCADCTTRGPRWASVNLGVWMCIRCSGIHRSLGVHISFVRSVNLDSWTEAQVQFMEAWGNERANAKWAANCTERKPLESDDTRVVARYIKNKYMYQKWMATDGDPPANTAPPASAPAPAAAPAAPASQPASTNAAEPRRVRRIQTAKKSGVEQGQPLTRIAPPQAAAPLAAVAAPEATIARPPAAPTGAFPATEPEVDLLGFSEPATVTPSPAAAPAPAPTASGQATSESLLGASPSPFDAAPDVAAPAQSIPAEKPKMSANDIMALYNNGAPAQNGFMMGQMPPGGPMNMGMPMQQLPQQQMMQMPQGGTMNMGGIQHPQMTNPAQMPQGPSMQMGMPMQQQQPPQQRPGPQQGMMMNPGQMRPGGMPMQQPAQRMMQMPGGMMPQGQPPQNGNVQMGMRMQQPQQQGMMMNSNQMRQTPPGGMQMGMPMGQMPMQQQGMMMNQMPPGANVNVGMAGQGMMMNGGGYRR